MKFHVRNYGCQMNERDAEKLRALFTQLGYELVKTQEEAQMLVLNTCCVRESAETKIFGHLSHIKTRKAADARLFIVVCGCMTQREEIAETFRAKHKYINVVCGTANRHRLPEMIRRSLETGAQIIDIHEDEGLPEITDIPVTEREFPHKAGVNIMYGCDNYCSFCIVPYVRGREKSRPPADILAEIHALANDGVREIMLLGQNVNSYLGAELDFPSLLREVHEIEGIQRIRFMTSHPKDLSDGLIAALRDLPKLCKTIHLPLQSGSTRILEDMNRKYTQQQYLELCEKLKKAVPGIGITTDIIVGYPGETEEDFDATLEVVRQVRFSGAFTFIYSKRSGTPAALRTDLVPREIVTDRFERLTALVYPIMQARNEARIGEAFPMMVEELDEKGGKGRLDDNALVHFTHGAGVLALGGIYPVRITAARSFYVNGAVECP